MEAWVAALIGVAVGYVLGCASIISFAIKETIKREKRNGQTI